MRPKISLLKVAGASALVVDRAQAQLMGHKFQRPKYGYGKDLTELREIIEPFAIR